MSIDTRNLDALALIEDECELTEQEIDSLWESATWDGDLLTWE